MEKSNLKVALVGGPFVQKVDPALSLVPTGKGRLAAGISDSLEKRFSRVERIGNFSGAAACTFEELFGMVAGMDANIVVFMPHLPNIIVEGSPHKLRIEEGAVGRIEQDG